MGRLVYGIDCQNAQRPADRGLDARCCCALHQPQKELHGMLAQPLALAGQPFVKITVAEREPVKKVRTIKRCGVL